MGSALWSDGRVRAATGPSREHRTQELGLEPRVASPGSPIYAPGMDRSRLAVRLPLRLSAVAFLSLALLAAGCSGSEGDAAAPVDDIAIEPADTEAPADDSAADTSTASEDAGSDTT